GDLMQRRGSARGNRGLQRELTTPASIRVLWVSGSNRVHPGGLRPTRGNHNRRGGWPTPAVYCSRRSRASHAAPARGLPTRVMIGAVVASADGPGGGAAAIQCEPARSAAAVNRRRRILAAAAVEGRPPGDVPGPDLFLEDIATIRADAGIGSAAAGERFS